MHIDEMKKLAQDLVDAGFAKSHPLSPCSEQDITELEQRFAVVLPESYRNFLRVMGRNGGDFLNDGIWEYPLEMVPEGANSLLTENEATFQLLPADFVYLCRDNFFLFFDTNAGDDPAVYIFKDGAREPQRFFESFSEWLTVCIRGEIAIRVESLQLEQKRLDRSSPTTP